LGRSSKLRLFDKGDVYTYVVASEVVHIGLGKHGIVFQLGFAERRGVAGNDDELSLSGTESLQSRLVSESDCERWRSAIDVDAEIPVQKNVLTFTRLHHKRQARVDAVGGLLGLLGRCHRCVSRLLDDLECGGRSGVLMVRRKFS
jgi:hypothetical protein